MDVWLNGRFVPRDEARISVFDAGFQHGVGLFETMLARNGRVFRPGAHMQRLAGAAQTLRLTTSLRTAPLAQAVQLTLDRSGLREARIRLTLTGGDLNMLARSRAGQGQSGDNAGAGAGGDPTILIVAQPATVYPPQFFENGVLVTIADARENPLNPMAGYKTLNYWPRISALTIAAQRQAAESLWFSVSNHLVGGSVSNIFIVKEDALHTPIARGEEGSESGAFVGGAPILPGIQRAAILELAEALGIPTHRRMLDINDLLTADEVFLTNSSWGVLPVVQVERESIRSGHVGEITRRLREAWLDIVQEETSDEGTGE